MKEIELYIPALNRTVKAKLGSEMTLKGYAAGVIAGAMRSSGSTELKGFVFDEEKRLISVIIGNEESVNTYSAYEYFKA